MHSGRLPVCDYRSAGWYFITICTYNRQPCFGQVRDGTMHLSELGRLADREWRRTLDLRHEAIEDVHLVMPNHVHLMFGLTDRDFGDGVAVPLPGSLRRFGQPEAGSIGTVVGGYKAAVTREARRAGFWSDAPLWQSRFHDRIVRNRDEYERIYRYILENPERWVDDRYNEG